MNCFDLQLARDADKQSFGVVPGTLEHLTETQITAKEKKRGGGARTRKIKQAMSFNLWGARLSCVLHFPSSAFFLWNGCNGGPPRRALSKMLRPSACLFVAY